MRFGALLGNDALKKRLAASLDRGHLSHSYLIAGPRGSGKHTLAQLLAAAMECQNPGAPCMDCPACRKVLSGNHPDVITVDEPDKKQVPVELIRRARADVFIRPNEGERKIFVFPRAQDMNEAAQNALLKILEEPPAYGVFLLLAETPEMLLPTIRSRCAELRLSPLPRELLRSELQRRCPNRDSTDVEAAIARSGGFLGQAVTLLESSELHLPQVERFATAYAARDTLALMELFCSMEKLKRNQMAPILEELRELLSQALLARRGCPTLSPAARAMAESHTALELLSACEAVKTAWDDCWANVGVANLCAGLFVHFR